jgi:hypothetical protein
MRHLAKALGAAVAIGAVVTAVGAAATLALGSNKLAAGKASVSSCGVSALSATRDVDNAGNVTQVNVSGIPAACAGETLSVTLTSSANASLGGASGTVPGGGGSMSFSSFGATVSAVSLSKYVFAVVGA